MIYSDLYKKNVPELLKVSNPETVQVHSQNMGGKKIKILE